MSGYSGTITADATTSVTTDFYPVGTLSPAGVSPGDILSLAQSIPVQVDCASWDGNTVSFDVKASGGGQWVTVYSFTSDDIVAASIPIGASVRFVDDGTGSPGAMTYSIGHHI